MEDVETGRVAKSSSGSTIDAHGSQREGLATYCSVKGESAPTVCGSAVGWQHRVVAVRGHHREGILSKSRLSGEWRMANLRLGIGTVQFGLDYGISNSQGKARPDEIVRILEAAGQAGIFDLDTAPGYGDAELALGKSEALSDFRVVTKIPQGHTNPLRCANASLARLGLSRIHGVLFHCAQDTFGKVGRQRVASLLRAKDSGCVAKVGVSVYSPAELEAAFRSFQPDIVQLPLNVLDRRFIVSGWIDRLLHAGIEIHIRSIFLQGLLLMDPQNLPAYFNPWKLMLTDYASSLKKCEVHPADAALAWVQSSIPKGVILIGVNSLDQFRSNLTSFQHPPNPLPDIPWDSFASTDERLLLPTSWHLT